MASSYSSAESNSQYSCPQRKYMYDVFLSFRGIDTRRNFTSYLYERLDNRGIFTFLDDKRLEDGDSLTKGLVKAIEESQVAVIIFSKNYATSRWCLNELVKIMECKEKKGQLVIPVFYHIDTSDVRSQIGSFAEAFDGYESRYKDDVEGMQKVQGWRTALTAAADLKGYDIRDRIEPECIAELVDEISPKVCENSLSYLTDLVGIDAHLKEVNSRLEMEVNDVRIVWIWGMMGVGKTTIARAIFDTHKSKFGGHCFLPDNKEKKYEIHSLQSILLSKLVREKENCVHDKEDGRHLLACRLRLKKVLVVLDNIDHRDQLEYLAGDLGWFGNGSRIIATTRNQHFAGKDDAVYKVPTLHEHDAVQLFNQYAFKNKVPDKCFEEITLEVVRHASGLPLALKVWGSFLHKKDIDVWRSAVLRIKGNTNSEIVEKLKISYDGLEREDQEIFLDIACFLRGRKQTEIKQILESCDIRADVGLRVLIDRSLVFISDDTIQMHGLLQKMGEYVVAKQKDRGELSRLWLSQDFEQFSNAKIQGTKAIEAIWTQEIQDLSFRKKVMKDVEKLRILHINGFHTHDCSNNQYLPSNLRWFDCCKYPWESLPSKFDPDRLVHLDLQQSSLLHLWTETKRKFPCLRRLDLSRCANLMRTPDFKEMPNLEYLGLEECSNLKEVHDSLKYSKKLMKLNLRDCKSLERFKYVSGESLEYLYLQGCSSLEKFPRIRGKIKPAVKIHVQRAGIRKLPSDIIQHQSSLTKLDLSGMENLATLPRDIGKLKGLVILDVSNCYKLESLPKELGDLVNLEKLDATGTLISRPPSSVVVLNNLKFMSFAKQRYSVSIKYRMYFEFPRVNEGLRSLENLDLSYCNLIDGGLPEDIGSLSSLKELNLTGNNFELLPQSIAQLGALRSLDLKECERLEELPGFMGMPNLVTLNLSTNNIRHLPQSIAQLGALRSLDLSYCKGLKELPSFMGMQNLENLNMSNCINLEKVHHSMGFLKKLRTLKLTNCRLLDRFPALCIDSLDYLCLRGCFSLEKIPEIIGSMKMELEIHMLDSVIRALGFRGFENLCTLPSSICKLKSLVSLNVSDCSKIKNFPEEIGDLENLENLDARGTLISQPPPSIVQLNKLKFLSFAKQNSGVGLVDGVYFVFPQVKEGLRSLEHLDLSYCNLIDGGLPDDIGCLHSLKELYLCGNNFEHLPQSIAQLGALRSLYLSDCERLKELPGFMGILNLETLNLSNCMNLEEVHHSLECLKKLCTLKLTNCKRLKRFLVLCIDSLEYLNLEGCSSLENFPKILGSMKVNSEIHMLDTVIRDLNSMYLSLPRSLSQDIVSLPNDISASDSLSQRVFTIVHGGNKIPSWFYHQGMYQSVTITLPENWCISDNFLGFAVCYSGNLVDTTVDLIPLCHDGMTQRLELSSLPNYDAESSGNSECDIEPAIHFFLVPLAVLWETSKANGKTPNDYGRITLSFSGEMKEFGFRLLYKDEPREHCIGTKRNRYDHSEDHDEASCSSSKR